MPLKRNEPGTVRKYFPALDDFVSLRLFGADQAAQLLHDARIESKRHYVQLVINACVVDYHEAVLPRLPAGAEEALYALCVSVNPDLEISRVTLPTAEPRSELHLVAPPAARRDVDRLRRIERALAERVIGQPQAIHAVGRAVKMGLTGLRDPRRPIAAFLFVGQTGVGKTELAKALADFLYEDDPEGMVRVDGSEYGMPHEYAKLIGAPPGYVGHDEGGSLTEPMRRSGERVVLFDEIEKSDRKVHDLLLQIIDEGFVTDSKGRRVRFNQAIIVLTSNVGSEDLDRLRARIGFGPPAVTTRAVSETLAGALREQFRPEFINRLSEVVVFNPIGLPECERITALMLEQVRRHAEAIPLRLSFAPPVPRYLAQKGYRPEFGARELRRTVEREVEEPLSGMIVDGRLREGDAVQVRVRRDGLQFDRN
jgi:ATP-dependent Clp protease ATP-binding subunit ClpC